VVKVSYAGSGGPGPRVGEGVRFKVVTSPPTGLSLLFMLCSTPGPGPMVGVLSAQNGENSGEREG